jgi:hypothetical protein
VAVHTLRWCEGEHRGFLAQGAGQADDPAVPFTFVSEDTMDPSIHALLISQYVKDRIEPSRLAGPVERRGVRLPRIAWQHSPRRRLRATAVGQK